MQSWQVSARGLSSPEGKRQSSQPGVGESRVLVEDEAGWTVLPPKSGCGEGRVFLHQLSKPTTVASLSRLGRDFAPRTPGGAACSGTEWTDRAQRLTAKVRDASRSMRRSARGGWGICHESHGQAGKKDAQSTRRSPDSQVK